MNDLNQPGIITRIQPLPDQQHTGRRITAAFLHLTFADGRCGALYAACCLPDGPGPHPAVIHCPGGTQTVDGADLTWWAGQGFACAALDWQCGFYAHHDPSRKSAWPPGVTLQDFAPRAWGDAVLPLAVQAVGALIDWLATMSAVDATRVGCTGISWGGYLTWLAGAYEPRLRAIVPVYGCGGLFAPERAWDGAVTPLRERYRATCDPLALAGAVRAPAAYLGAACDFFGWTGVADQLLNALRVPSRRCWAANLDHAVLPGQSALAVAWMRHHLAAGAALPAEPAWRTGQLVIDRPDLVVAIEQWWTPSSGPDDLGCWWPGEAPADAPVGARLGSVTYRDGVTLSTAVTPGTPEERSRPLTDLGDRWPDARAGLGWSTNLGGPQLHGNAIAVTTTADGVDLHGEHGDGFQLYALADPRWNRAGFAGLRVRLAGIAPQRRIRLTLRAECGALRPEWRSEQTIGADGVVLVDRSTVPLPADVPWSQVKRLSIDGLGTSHFTVVSLERLSAQK